MDRDEWSIRLVFTGQQLHWVLKNEGYSKAEINHAISDLSFTFAPTIYSIIG